MQIGLDLSAVPVQETGLAEPVCVEPDVPTRRVLQLLKERARGEVLVCRGGDLVGIFTERDALGLLAAGEALDAPIEQVMTPNPVTLLAGDSVAAAVVKMSANGYRRLPVVDAEGRPTGVVNVAGIVHWLAQHFPKAVYNLPPASKPASKQREGP